MRALAVEMMMGMAVMTLHDYGHTASLRNWFTWLGHAARNQSWRIPRDISQATPV